jgi:hypothetical protein
LNIFPSDLRDQGQDAMHIKHSSRNWRSILLMAILTGAIGLASADGGAPTKKALQAVTGRGLAPRSQIAENAATAPCGDAGSVEATRGDEPLPPNLFDVTQDASDSQSVNVTVRPAATGYARLEVTADQGVTWTGESAPTGLRLERGAAPRRFAFKTRSKRSDQPNRASVRLTLLDDRGRVLLTYDKTLDLNAKAARKMATATADAFAHPNATDGQGEPVIAVVPKNAPTPILTEADR